MNNLFSYLGCTVGLLLGGFGGQTALAQNQSPVFELESVLDMFFHSSNGTLRFGDYTVAFVPDGAFRGEAAVINSAGKTVARFPFFEDYQARAAVFGRVQIQGPAEVQLTEPGIYNLIFLAGGKPVTRVPFVLKSAGSNDPFNPATTYVFDGLWRNLGHITQKTTGDQMVPHLTFWIGGPDLAATSKQDGYNVTLLREDKVVAHSKRTQGQIAPGHFKRTEIPLFHPHAERQAFAARYFNSKDWLVDGSHELRVTRKSDDVQLRSFKFTVAQGVIQGLPRSQLTYEPRLDLIVPRVAKKNVNVFEVTEATWLEDK